MGRLCVENANNCKTLVFFNHLNNVRENLRLDRLEKV
jgi:hypothetical protein